MTSSFISGGRSIEYVSYEPCRGGSFPALIVLHGSNGPVSSFVGDYAQQLADFGYVVYFVHYFDRTGTGYATPTLIYQNFPAWLKTVADAVSHVAQNPKVDVERIGLLGVSLGGYLTLASASQDERITAAVSLMGGMPDYFIDHVRQMPPTLLLHGEDDSVVPVTEAYKTERILKALGTKYELKIYKDQGHSFRGLSQFDALTRTMSFLNANLKNGKKRAAAPELEPLPAQ